MSYGSSTFFAGDPVRVLVTRTPVRFSGNLQCLSKTRRCQIDRNEIMVSWWRMVREWRGWEGSGLFLLGLGHSEISKSCNTIDDGFKMIIIINKKLKTHWHERVHIAHMRHTLSIRTITKVLALICTECWGGLNRPCATLKMYEYLLRHIETPKERKNERNEMVSNVQEVEPVTTPQKKKKSTVSKTHCLCHSSRSQWAFESPNLVYSAPTLSTKGFFPINACRESFYTNSFRCSNLVSQEISVQHLTLGCYDEPAQYYKFFKN